MLNPVTFDLGRYLLSALEGLEKRIQSFYEKLIDELYLISTLLFFQALSEKHLRWHICVQILDFACCSLFNLYIQWRK